MAAFSLTGLWKKDPISFSQFGNVVKEKRTNEAVYWELIRCVLHKTLSPVKRDEWSRQGVANQFKLETKATVADEAFLLLVLDNNLERWEKVFPLLDDIVKIRDSDYMSVRAKWQKKKKLLDANKVPKALYTGERTKKGEGWSEAGIRRYDSLLKEVVDDRTKNGTSFNKYACDYYISKNEQCRNDDNIMRVDAGKETTAVSLTYDFGDIDEPIVSASV